MKLAGEDDVHKWGVGSEYVGGTNILGLVVFSVVLGVAIGKSGRVTEPLQKFFQVSLRIKGVF